MKAGTLLTHLLLQNSCSDVGDPAEVCYHLQTWCSTNEVQYVSHVGVDISVFPAPASSVAAGLLRAQVRTVSHAVTELRRERVLVQFSVDQTSRPRTVWLSCSYRHSTLFYCKWQHVSFAFGCHDFGMFVIRLLLAVYRPYSRFCWY